MTILGRYHAVRWKVTLDPERVAFVYARSVRIARRIVRKAIQAKPELGTLKRLEEDKEPWQPRLLIDHDNAPNSRKTK